MSNNVAQLKSPMSADNGLTEKEATDLVKLVNDFDAEIETLNGKATTIRESIASKTDAERSEIKSLEARIIALRTAAAAKVVQDEADLKALVSQVSAIQTQRTPLSQRLQTYVTAQMNRYAKLLPAKAAKMVSSVGTGNAQRHGKGCQDGTLRAKGGVCQLCQTQGTW